MLNHITLQGRLVATPELRQTNSGKSVTSFRVASDRGAKDSAGNALVDWLDCIAWGKTAEFVCKYFTKGEMILISGSIQTRQYQDKNGSNRTATEINAERVFFCGRQSTQANGETRAQGEFTSSAFTRGSAQSFVPIDDSEDLPF